MATTSPYSQAQIAYPNVADGSINADYSAQTYDERYATALKLFSGK